MRTGQFQIACLKGLSAAFAALVLSACNTAAQVRSVSVDSNGAVVAPTNFFAANATSFGQFVPTAGNGLVLSAGKYHFGQAAPYTVGLIPYATGSNTIGFHPGLQFFPNQGSLSIQGNMGAATVSASDGGDFFGHLKFEFLDVMTVNYSVLTTGSLTGGGNFQPGSRTLSLVNDSTTPGNSRYYGTDAGGTKGFFPLNPGTVTSIGLSVPSWLSVSPTNITDSGTFAVTAAGAQTANRFLATPDGATGAVALRAIVPGDIPSLDASILGSGTVAPARLGSGTLGSTTFLGGDSVFRQVADSQVSPSAAIAKSKISTGSTWADADIPSTVSRITGTEALQNKTVQTTGAGGNNTLKFKDYIILPSPNSCDGTGAVIYTNDNTKAYFGQAAFSGSAAASGNYVEYRIWVPRDIDTSVDLKVEDFKFRLGAADTAGHSYVISMASVADSASSDSPTLAQSVTLTFAGDASGASGDVETISGVTLTNWKSNLTAGQFWVIRLARNGDTDASTQISYSGPLVLSFGRSQ